MHFGFIRLAAAVVSLAMLGGCATRGQLEKVQRDQREVRALLADQGVTIDGLRRRIEILKQDMGEPGKGSKAATSAQLTQRLADLEARLTAIEQSHPAPSTTTPPPPTDQFGTSAPPSGAAPPDFQPTPAPPKPVSPLEADLAKEEASLQGQRVDLDYRDGLNLVRQGQCNQAAPRLRDFIRKNPKSDLADNAQYWIGACYYGQREYNQAIKELSDVMLRYSKGDKAPAALLMLADAFNDSGDQIDAKLVLKKLISEHPRTEEAESARQKLQKLGD
ncbi:MAG TPA: tol-pal system protein YbgF [Candidatus Acidoferrales bacterium]|nr:tol-pal system protein YbgF [Candidatus Acidoferrales bacterium]